MSIACCWILAADGSNCNAKLGTTCISYFSLFSGFSAPLLKPVGTSNGSGAFKAPSGSLKRPRSKRGSNRVTDSVASDNDSASTMNKTSKDTKGQQGPLAANTTSNGGKPARSRGRAAQRSSHGRNAEANGFVSDDDFGAFSADSADGILGQSAAKSAAGILLSLSSGLHRSGIAK